MPFGLRLAPHYACIWANKHSRGSFGILQTNQSLVHQPENHLLASPDGASRNGECWSLNELKQYLEGLGGVVTVRDEGEGKVREALHIRGCVFGCIHRAPSPARRQC